MQASKWRCPQCHQTLFITNAAIYWCSQCQAEKERDTVDPMARDAVMNRIFYEYSIERIINKYKDTAA